MLNLASLTAAVEQCIALDQQIIAKLNAPDPGQPAVDELVAKLNASNEAKAAALNPQPSLPGIG